MPCSKSHTHTSYVHSRYSDHGKLLFSFQRHPCFKAMSYVTPRYSYKHFEKSERTHQIHVLTSGG